MKKLRTLKISKYIVLLLVLILSVTFVNIWFYRSFKNQAIEINKYVQDQIICRISEYYEEINAFVAGTMSDNEILQLQSFTDKEQVYRSETVLSLVQQLRANKNRSFMIRKTFVYIDELELVLCESGIIESETFYDIEGRKYFDSYEHWLQAVKTENHRKNFFANDKSIMFSFSLNGLDNFENNKRNIIIGAFSDKEDVFVKTPHIDWVNKCNIYVYDRNGQISLSEENVIIDSLAERPAYAELQDKKSSYDTLSYDVTINDSVYYIVVAFEKNLNMQTVKNVQIVSVVVTVISFLLVFFYFYNLYAKRYKPIKAISALLGINIDKIDYTLIEKPIKNIIGKNQLLNQMLEKNNSNLKLIILKKLLTGDLSKEFMNDLENMGIKLSKEGCFVVVTHLYTDSDITENESINLINAFEDEISAIIGEEGEVYFVLEKQNIICICNTEKDYDLNKFGASILDVTKELEEKYDFVAYVAVSNMHTRYWHISKAYAEAMEAMSDGELYDKSKVVFYSEEQGMKRDHRFNLDEETKLTDAIKNGDIVAAEEIIKNAIGRINPEKTFLYMNVSVGLVYSLMRIADLLFGEEFDTRSIAFLLKNTDDLSALSGACLEIAQNMCESIKKTSGEGENKIAKKVREYIHNNYSNSQLTAKSIADEMKYSFVYLNNLFKQEYSSTIVAYLNCYRVEKAKELIKQSIPINETAKSVGILSIRTFNRQFQSLTGMTPTEYKRNSIGRDEINE